MLIPDNQKPLNVTCFRDVLFVKLTLLFCYVYFRRDYYKHCFMKKKRKTHATELKLRSEAYIYKQTYLYFFNQDLTNRS